ncbi:MAG: DMT family transporter [Ruminococcaceae bacterium]|nr:DMT family transporter [Oscillospiraceae bacterium]
MKNFKGSIILLVTALIWGTAFVAQSVGMDHIGPFTFNSIRNFIGALTLLPFILIFDFFKKKKGTIAPKEDKKTLWVGGILCGIVLAVASSLQQIGLIYTKPGKAGFITALYIVFVPLVKLFTKNKPKPRIWVSVLLAVIGMYLLCMKESLTLEIGDFYVLLCAIAFTFHILVIDKYSPKVDCVKMSCIQFLVAGILCGICMLFEDISLEGLKLATMPILYTGIMSSGVAYTLQIVGQKHTNPTLATIIMSLESVFSALAGWVILGDVMSTGEIFGSLIMFVAIIIAQFA